uniref:SDE2-like domain-containing protein n=1 Tax=Timspurckia oligopyrenoides TaxID=708627 RepID=A0A7S1EUH7_9RHOD|mmetsp:Transcript_8476/g.15341  ORF Transcript_8476/g.15341 Transcript_8476/m.15341 type:complete len:223 (+) Transcript_8476:1-669(+)
MMGIRVVVSSEVSGTGDRNGVELEFCGRVVSAHDVLCSWMEWFEKKQGLMGRQESICELGLGLFRNSKKMKCHEYVRKGEIFVVKLSSVLMGGKGGFGSLLKGKGSMKKTSDNDNCRDLLGRRIGSVRIQQQAQESSQIRRETAAESSRVSAEQPNVQQNDKALSEIEEKNETSLRKCELLKVKQDARASRIAAAVKRGLNQTETDSTKDSDSRSKRSRTEC